MVAIHLAHPYFGYPWMKTALREVGYLVNHKKVWRLTKELSLLSVIRKKRNTPSVVYPNRLKRQFHAVGPQQKLVTDITYISDGTRFYYLSPFKTYSTTRLWFGSSLSATTRSLS
jgi:putative transposase